MQFSGTQRVDAPRENVWRALNDADVLKRCIPGCQELTQTSTTEMTAKVVLKIGPIKATFISGVSLRDFDPPNGYVIVGEGKGGVAGFAKGSARVRLESDGQATILHYEVKSEVGGKIAQLGARLIDSTAKKLAGEFFEAFGKVAV
jgi:carbon monoxide dehydrogenase subunit G